MHAIEKAITEGFLGSKTLTSDEASKNLPKIAVTNSSTRPSVRRRCRPGLAAPVPSALQVAGSGGLRAGELSPAYGRPHARRRSLPPLGSPPPPAPPVSTRARAAMLVGSVMGGGPRLVRAPSAARPRGAGRRVRTGATFPAQRCRHIQVTGGRPQHHS